MSRAAFRDAVRAEWTKLHTLRSPWYALAGTVLLGVGLSSLMTFADTRLYPTMSPQEQAAYDPVARSLAGYVLAQLALGFLGAFVVTAEHATGSIHTSLTVVPRRNRLLAAKLVVFGAVAIVAGELVGFGAFLTGQAILGSQNLPHATLTQPDVLRAVVGDGLYLAVVGLFGMALGVLVRATAGALAILTSATLLVPILTTTLPEALARIVVKYWFSMAGGRLMARPNPELLGPWAGFGLMCAVVAAILAAAFIAFRRRDV